VEKPKETYNLMCCAFSRCAHRDYRVCLVIAGLEELRKWKVPAVLLGSRLKLSLEASENESFCFANESLKKLHKSFSLPQKKKVFLSKSFSQTFAKPFFR
jgi:hypothetical protein